MDQVDEAIFKNSKEFTKANVFYSSSIVLKMFTLNYIEMAAVIWRISILGQSCPLRKHYLSAVWYISTTLLVTDNILLWSLTITILSHVVCHLR